MRADEYLVEEVIRLKDVIKKNEEDRVKLTEQISELTKKLTGDNTKEDPTANKKIYEYSYENKAFLLFHLTILDDYDLSDISYSLTYNGEEKPYSTLTGRKALFEDLSKLSDDELIKLANKLYLKKYSWGSPDNIYGTDKVYFDVVYDCLNGTKYYLNVDDSRLVKKTNDSSTSNYFYSIDGLQKQVVVKLKELFMDVIERLTTKIQTELAKTELAKEATK